MNNYAQYFITPEAQKSFTSFKLELNALLVSEEKHLSLLQQLILCDLEDNQALNQQIKHSAQDMASQSQAFISDLKRVLETPDLELAAQKINELTAKHFTLMPVLSEIPKTNYASALHDFSLMSLSSEFHQAELKKITHAPDSKTLGIFNQLIMKRPQSIHLMFLNMRSFLFDAIQASPELELSKSLPKKHGSLPIPELQDVIRQSSKNELRTLSASIVEANRVIDGTLKVINQAEGKAYLNHKTWSNELNPELNYLFRALSTTLRSKSIKRELNRQGLSPSKLKHAHNELVALLNLQNQLTHLSLAADTPGLAPETSELYLKKIALLKKKLVLQAPQLEQAIKTANQIFLSTHKKLAKVPGRLSMREELDFLDILSRKSYLLRQTAFSASDIENYRRKAIELQGSNLVNGLFNTLNQIQVKTHTENSKLAWLPQISKAKLKIGTESLTQDLGHIYQNLASSALHPQKIVKPLSWLSFRAELQRLSVLIYDLLVKPGHGLSLRTTAKLQDIIKKVQTKYLDQVRHSDAHTKRKQELSKLKDEHKPARVQKRTPPPLPVPNPAPKKPRAQPAPPTPAKPARKRP